MKTALWLIISCALILSGCAKSGTGLNLYSYEHEASIGNQYAQGVNKELKIIHDPILTEYIQNLGQKMVNQGLLDPHFTYTFSVVDSSEVNAFALPGGHLYVNLGLLKEAENEAEVVGVIGHEIGHVANRHGTKRMTDAALLQMASIAAAQASGEEKGRYVGLGVMLFGQAGLLKYGRNAELEADRTGIDILYRTGYDAHALSSFFKKLQKIQNEHGIKEGGLSELLATHPATGDRIEKAEAYLATLPPQNNPKLNSPEFEKLRKHIAPMKPSAPPK